MDNAPDSPANEMVNLKSTRDKPSSPVTPSSLTTQPSAGDIIIIGDNDETRPRAGSSFEIHPEKCNLQCIKVTINRKDCIICLQLLIVFIAVAAYFMYELTQYLDDKTNRKQYTIHESVAEMPLPFVYVDFQDSGTKDCGVDAFYLQHANFTDYSGQNNISMEYIIENESAEFPMLIYRYDAAYEYHQIMFMPSNTHSTIEVDSKDVLEISLTCIGDSTEYLWYYVNHKEQLYNYDTLEAAMDTFWSISDYIYIDYEIRFSYEWFSFKNKIKNVLDYDYLFTSIESTFTGEYASVDSVSEIYLKFAPNTAGKKTTFVTARALDFWEIFSLTGGMFTAVSSIVGFIVVYCIWGCDYGVVKFTGIAKNSNPSQLEQRRMKPYVRRLVRDYYEEKQTKLEAKLIELVKNEVRKVSMPASPGLDNDLTIVLEESDPDS